MYFAVDFYIDFISNAIPQSGFCNIGHAFLTDSVLRTAQNAYMYTDFLNKQLRARCLYYYYY